MNNNEKPNKEGEKLFPNDGFVYFDTIFQKMRDRRKALWLKSGHSKRRIVNESLANLKKKD